MKEVKGDTKIFFNLADWKNSGAIHNNSRKIKSVACFVGKEILRILVTVSFK